MTNNSDSPATAYYLVGDIGGTNARFAFMSPGERRPSPLARYLVADFATFDDVLSRLSKIGKHWAYPRAGQRKPVLLLRRPHT
jgi:glucokinase